MNADQMNIKQEKEDLNSTTNARVGKGRWIVKGINYARGYAKLSHLATGEKRYVAILDFPGYKARFSWGLFLKAESAIARRKEVYRRLERLKTAAIKALADESPN